MLDRRSLLGTAAAVAAVAAGPAQGARRVARRIALWPAGLPEAAPNGLAERFAERSNDPGIHDRSLAGIVAPWLEQVAHRSVNGAAVIAIPGGGYDHLAWDKEGLDIAGWFADHGVCGFALAYRLPGDGWAGGLDTPLADAMRAVRVVRSRAGEFGIDPRRIAVVGFSAGGHLAANLAAHCDEPNIAPRDAIDLVSARPDLVAPIYPAIALDLLAQAVPASSPLSGTSLGGEGLRRHSPHLHVRSDTPPHFLLHAEDDPLVGPEHSLALRAALKARGVAVETHLHARGGHGFGIRNTAGTSLGDWPQRLMAFGRTTGWIA